MSKLVVTVLSLVGVAVGFFTTIDPDFCKYNGKIYAHGEDIYTDPDNCYGSFCDLGYVLHWDAECFFATPACSGQQIKVPGQCCPDCIETTTPIQSTPVGCYVNGSYYEIGDYIPQTDPCKICQCTRLYGVLCRMTSCAPVQCVNPIKKKNQCCPICPTGPNCWYGRRKIKVGKVYKPKPNIKCSCPDPYEPLACCKKMPSRRSYLRKMQTQQKSYKNSILKGPHCWYGDRKLKVGKVYRPKPNVQCACPEPYEPLACCRKLPNPRSYLKKRLRQQREYMNPILRRYIEKYLENKY